MPHIKILIFCLQQSNEILLGQQLLNVGYREFNNQAMFDLQDKFEAHIGTILLFISYFTVYLYKEEKKIVFA